MRALLVRTLSRIGTLLVNDPCSFSSRTLPHPGGISTRKRRSWDCRWLCTWVKARPADRRASREC